MKTHLFIYLILIATNLIGQDMNIQIIPTPQKITMMEKTEPFIFPKEINISLNHSKTEKHKNIINHLSECIENKYSVKPNFTFDSKNTRQINLNLVNSFDHDDLIPEEYVDETYIISITKENILVEAKALKGIYYGVLSLTQLINSSDNNELPRLKIIDYPNMKIRGISDDFSRGQVSTMDNFKRIIKFISEYKMNTYMPYMEDVIQFESFPEIGVGQRCIIKK